MIGQPHLRPLNIVELLVASIRLYRNNFLPFVLITALVLVPYNLLNFVLADSTPPLAIGDLIASFLRSTYRPSGSGWIGLIYNLIVQPILYGTLILTAAQYYRQQSLSIRNNFKAAQGRLINLLGVSLQKALFMVVSLALPLVIGFVALVILEPLIPNDWGIRYPSVLQAHRVILYGLAWLVPLYVGVRLIVAAQALLIEDHFASESINRSWNLTKDSSWRVATFVLVVLLIQIGLPALFLGAAMAGVARLSLDAQLVSALQMALATIAQIVALPFSFIAYTLLFFDLRVRSQGFDLQQHDPLAAEWDTGKYPSWLSA